MEENSFKIQKDLTLIKINFKKFSLEEQWNYMQEIIKKHLLTLIPMQKKYCFKFEGQIIQNQDQFKNCFPGEEISQRIISLKFCQSNPSEIVMEHVKNSNREVQEIKSLNLQLKEELEQKDKQIQRMAKERVQQNYKQVQLSEKNNILNIQIQMLTADSEEKAQNLEKINQKIQFQKKLIFKLKQQLGQLYKMKEMQFQKVPKDQMFDKIKKCLQLLNFQNEDKQEMQQNPIKGKFYSESHHVKQKLQNKKNLASSFGAYLPNQPQLSRTKSSSTEVNCKQSQTQVTLADSNQLQTSQFHNYICQRNLQIESFKKMISFMKGLLTSQQNDLLLTHQNQTKSQNLLANKISINHMEKHLQASKCSCKLKNTINVIEKQHQVQKLQRKKSFLEKQIQDPLESARIQKQVKELNQLKSEFITKTIELINKIDPLTFQIKSSKEKSLELIKYLQKSIQNNGRKNYGLQSQEDFQDSNTLALDLIQTKNEEIDKFGNFVTDMHSSMKKLVKGFESLKNEENKEILREIANIKI